MAASGFDSDPQFEIIYMPDHDEKGKEKEQEQEQEQKETSDEKE